MTLLALLDNVVWHSLSGPQAGLAAGNERVRRYAPGYSPLIGAVDPAAPDLNALGAFCRPGEQFYLSGWSGSPPRPWRLDVDTFMEQYVWDAPAPPDPDLPLERLGSAHVAQAMALVELTHPGPFAERTLELGEFYGLFDAGRLIAMAGERMHAGALREVSAVCTHPAFQGRGLARRLMEKVIRGQVARGQTPFLHVMSANATARALYERMGFRHHQTLSVRAITYIDDARYRG
jgi:ribosomal protein S18 acetylase RimI-like enzyme